MVLSIVPIIIQRSLTWSPCSYRDWRLTGLDWTGRTLRYQACPAAHLAFPSFSHANTSAFLPRSLSFNPSPSLHALHLHPSSFGLLSFTTLSSSSSLPVILFTLDQLSTLTSLLLYSSSPHPLAPSVPLRRCLPSLGLSFPSLPSSLYRSLASTPPGFILSLPPSRPSRLSSISMPCPLLHSLAPSPPLLSRFSPPPHFGFASHMPHFYSLALCFLLSYSSQWSPFLARPLVIRPYTHPTSPAQHAALSSTSDTKARPTVRCARHRGPASPPSVVTCSPLTIYAKGRR